VNRKRNWGGTLPLCLVAAGGVAVLYAGGSPCIFWASPSPPLPFVPVWLRPGLAGRWGLARHWPSQSPDMACSATLCDLLRASRSEEAQHV